MRNTFLFLFFSAVLVSGQVIVKDDITSDATWTSSNEYHLDGLIFVDSTVTLTIEAGTVIKGLLSANITTGDGASALIVRRGAKIMAEGEADNPIIFTSELDDLALPDLTWQDRGLWGGIIILGRAATNQPTTENQIEGIPNELNARYGGNDDNDNSGVLKFVSIRHGGFSISGIAGDEINGLTMGAVGDGTIIEYIEVFSNFDDGYEWFGGTVNTRNLVAAFCGDDAYDYDQGFRGKGQFWFTIQGQDEAGRGGEHDGGDDNETGEPYSMPYISNVTYIGSGHESVGVAGDGNDRGIYFRDNAGGKYFNSVFTEYVGYGVKVEDIEGQDSRQQMEDGNLVLNNNYWWNFGKGNTVSDIADGVDFVIDHLGANNNSVADPELRSISWTEDAGLDPRPAAGSPIVSGAVVMEDSWFKSVDYLGAFDPDNGIWTEGWTTLSAYGFTPSTVVGVEEDNNITSLPQEYSLSQNYPNPFNPSTNIQFAIPENANVRLSIYNVLGQEIKVLVDEFRSAGSYTVEWNAGQMASGMYIYRLQTDAKVLTKKMALLK